MQKLDPLCNKLGLHQLDKIEHLQQLEKKTKVAPRHMAIVLVTLLIIMIILEYGSAILCQVLGFIYPAYMSFKAIESPGEGDDKQWLTYWVVFCFFTLLDMSLGFLLSVIPFYSLIKLCIFIYMFHPKTQGATVIYTNILRPFLLKNQNIIDQKIGAAKEKANKTIDDGVDLVDKGVKIAQIAEYDRQ